MHAVVVVGSTDFQAETAAVIPPFAIQHQQLIGADADDAEPAELDNGEMAMH